MDTITEPTPTAADAPTVTPTWALRPAQPSDAEAIAELRAVVMRPDLERLGRYDPVRVRQRFLDAFAPAHTWVILTSGAFAGAVALRPAEDGWWLEHFYLAPDLHGRGLGTAVLRSLLSRADDEARPVHLTVLQGSPARRLYERHGFTLTTETPIDLSMTRHPDGYTPA